MCNEKELVQRLEALENEVQELKDKEAIRDVLSRYGHYYDLGYFDEWYDLWTEDCKYISVKEFKNKKEIKEVFGEQKKSHLAEQHIQIAVVIKVNGDTAKAIGYQVVPKHSVGQFFEEVVLDPRLPIGFGRIGVRSWSFERVDGKWLISGTCSRDMIDEAGVKEVLPPGW
jgi:hypothetical protein